jgi:exopolyphosphatase/guanosine-5'-triphosphate,3'-diphosphate pyrophosphatase
VRVAIIDCGTNTIRLLIAEAAGAGLATLVRELRYVRLGQGVDATRRFHPEALARTFAAAAEYAQIIAAHGVDRARFLATSASRDVANRDEFAAGIEARLGLAPEVITGEEEGRFSFLGALAGGPVAPGPVLVTDVGGGSTELILGDATGVIRAAQSLDVGSVRLRERFLHSDPPTPAEVGAARAFTGHLLDTASVPLAGAATWLYVDQEMYPPPEVIQTWIGVAGTNTSASAMLQKLTVYDPALVHNSVIALDDLAALSDRLLRLTVAEAMAEYPILAPLRAEVIGAGTLIAAEIGRRVGRPMTVRETDILDGAALDLIRASS